MAETQVAYQVGRRVKITSQTSTYSGKTGIIRGVFCAGLPDKEHYVVHIDGDQESTHVYHFFSDDMEPVTGGPIFGPSIASEYVQKDKEQSITASRSTEAQLLAMLREAKAGQMTIEALCRKHAIGDAAFYRWLAEYGGLAVSEAVRLNGLERENARLKKLLAERDLEIEIMKEVNAKIW